MSKFTFTDRLISHGGNYPVSLADCRAAMGINRADDDVRDNIIDDRIKLASEWIEDYTYKAFTVQTRRLTSTDYCYNKIFLRTGDISNVTVEYWNGAGYTTLATTDFVVSQSTGELMIYPDAIPANPPSVLAPEKLVINYTTGTIAAPETVKQSIIFIVSYFENFQNSILDPSGGGLTTMPYAIKEMLDSYINYYWSGVCSNG